MGVVNRNKCNLIILPMKIVSTVLINEIIWKYCVLIKKILTLRNGRKRI